MKNKIRTLSCYFVFCLLFMILTGCLQNTKSCTGQKTYQTCAHLCTRYEVTICEASYRASKKKHHNQYQKNNRNYQNRNNSNY